MTDKKQPRVQIVVPVGTAAFTYLHEPDTQGQYATGKFKTNSLVDDSFDISEIEGKCKAFAQSVFPELTDEDLEDLKLPFKLDPDHKREEWRDKFIFFASTKRQPKLVDSKKKPLGKKVKIFSGDEVRLVGSLYAYKNTEKVREGKKVVDVTVYGVSIQLNTVQLVRKNSGGDSGLGLLDELDGDDLYEAEDDEAEDQTEDNSSDDDDIPF